MPRSPRDVAALTQIARTSSAGEESLAAVGRLRQDEVDISALKLEPQLPQATRNYLELDPPAMGARALQELNQWDCGPSRW